MSKIIVITGASSGIGKDAALHLLSLGYTVYGCARDTENMQDIKKAGGHAIKMDVTDEAMVSKGIKGVLEKEGKIDVLVNNAGFGLYGAIEDIPLDDARYQFEVNLFGVASLCRAVLPSMRKRKKGTIINISSMGGRFSLPMGAWYHSSKHALEGWTDSLRMDVHQFGIKVVLIEPGVIKTSFGNVAGKPILKYSAEGAYKKTAKAMAHSMSESYKPDGSGSDAIVVAETIQKIIKSNNPKPRYLVGHLAKTLVWSKKILGDRTFDKLVRSQIG